jgi:hypothetical protein
MRQITLKITAKVPIHGQRPGDVFSIEADAEGTPLDLVWRKRLDDERKFKIGAVEVVSAASEAAKVE